jgi:hypothetical protein
MVEEVIEIASFRFVHEAELAATALRAAGVKCTIPDNKGHGRTPGNIFTGQTFRLLVNASDATRAREILQQ